MFNRSAFLQMICCNYRFVMTGNFETFLNYYFRCMKQYFKIANETLHCFNDSLDKMTFHRAMELFGKRNIKYVESQNIFKAHFTLNCKLSLKLFLSFLVLITFYFAFGGFRHSISKEL